VRLNVGQKSFAISKMKKLRKMLQSTSKIFCVRNISFKQKGCFISNATFTADKNG